MGMITNTDRSIPNHRISWFTLESVIPSFLTSIVTLLIGYIILAMIGLCIYVTEGSMAYLMWLGGIIMLGVVVALFNTSRAIVHSILIEHQALVFIYAHPLVRGQLSKENQKLIKLCWSHIYPLRAPIIYYKFYRVLRHCYLEEKMQPTDQES